MSDPSCLPVEAAPQPRIVCVAGLGNPGSRYDATPHNIGFAVVDELARRHRIPVLKNESGALTGVGDIGGRKVFLAKPQTFMNNSGPAIRAVLKLRNLTTRDLVVVHDEMDLFWTGLRIKVKGSAAGHNGVKSLIGALGTDAFLRVRVGIRPDHPVDDTAVYVLAPFERAMREDIPEVVSYTADAIEEIVAEGANRAMTKFNRRARGSTEEDE